MNIETFDKHKLAQDVARETMQHLSGFIVEGVTEQEIVQSAEAFMQSKGIKSFWYYDVGAFVLVGERTVLSLSGRGYKSSDLAVRDTDLVTVDLSPEIDGCWGDHARSFVVKEGKVVDSGAIFQGVEVEKDLHSFMQRILRKDMLFEELHLLMNKRIQELGFHNLDFKGNLGHTIVSSRDGREYIEQGCKLKFGDAGLFTFEPHIAQSKSTYGFKMEDIYYFEGGELKTL